jgi:hypothetical protein
LRTDHVTYHFEASDS